MENWSIGDMIILTAVKAMIWGAVIIWLAYILRPVLMALAT